MRAFEHVERHCPHSFAFDGHISAHDRNKCKELTQFRSHANQDERRRTRSLGGIANAEQQFHTAALESRTAKWTLAMRYGNTINGTL